MPEGDTVRNTARALDVLVGQELSGSEFRVPRLATSSVTGWTVAESASYGKHLLLRLSKDDRRVTLHSHLRMDGSWRLYRAGQLTALLAARASAPRRGGHTVRVVLSTVEVAAVGYHLHEIALLKTADEGRLIGHLGPDLLGANWDPQEAVRRLRRGALARSAGSAVSGPHTPIGEALLEQRNLAGIGNLWKAEILFAHRTSPWTLVGEVADLEGLVERAQVLMASPKRTEFVYGRRGRPCRRCGTAIRADGQGERITYWCPKCQA